MPLKASLLPRAQAGGPAYPVELGRLDGLVSTASNVDGNLPPPSFNLDQLTAMFAANNLSQADMIALSGKARQLLKSCLLTAPANPPNYFSRCLYWSRSCQEVPPCALFSCLATHTKPGEKGWILRADRGIFVGTTVEIMWFIVSTVSKYIFLVIPLD